MMSYQLVLLDGKNVVVVAASSLLVGFLGLISQLELGK